MSQDEVLGLSADLRQSSACQEQQCRSRSSGPTPLYYLVIASSSVIIIFPEHGYKIAPMGFMFLQPKNSGQMPHTGPLTYVQQGTCRFPQKRFNIWYFVSLWLKYKWESCQRKQIVLEPSIKSEIVKYTKEQNKSTRIISVYCGQSR